MIVTLLLELGIPCLIAWLFWWVLDRYREPVGFALLAACMGVFTYFFEFLLMRPALAKVFFSWNISQYIYFINDEYYNLHLSRNNLWLILIITLSKTGAYVFMYSWTLSIIRIFSNKKDKPEGVIDEPIDYAVYAVLFMMAITAVENITYARFDLNAFTPEKLFGYLSVFRNLFIALVLGGIWQVYAYPELNRRQVFKLIPSIWLQNDKLVIHLFHKKTFFAGLILTSTLFLFRLFWLVSLGWGILGDAFIAGISLILTVRIYHEINTSNQLHHTNTTPP